MQYRIRVYQEVLRSLDMHLPADVTLICACGDPWPCTEHWWAARVIIKLERRIAR